MAASLDDRPLVAGVNENWDDINTYEQVKHPNSDISPTPNFLRYVTPRTPRLSCADTEHFLDGARPLNSPGLL